MIHKHSQASTLQKLYYSMWPIFHTDARFYKLLTWYTGNEKCSDEIVSLLLTSKDIFQLHLRQVGDAVSRAL